ncbi:hypothetical protein DLJ53_28845 [Acuticoccus sediminis]|uniref:Uncharacterized protein n=1 Tax=Acuticoccus sediminis TaxID=2184697 RepID=A0A8B2NJN2_9HYPH|nr:hypothetical protein [Acuticoccus sediminis]RAH97842.1 hypothetical protein DLJ53_28845 [Acuticoccus sediminis]
MSEEHREDSNRAFRAAMEIIGGRDPVTEMPAVMVTLEHAVATVLLAAADRDPRIAACLMSEGLAPRMDDRLAMVATKQGGAS